MGVVQQVNCCLTIPSGWDRVRAKEREHMTKKIKKQPSVDTMAKNNIVAFLHCKKCLDSLPDNVSPRKYASIEIGWTKWGFQAWCTRHEANMLHVDFEGLKHPAVTSRLGRHH